MMGIEAVRKL